MADREHVRRARDITRRSFNRYLAIGGSLVIAGGGATAAFLLGKGGDGPARAAATSRASATASNSNEDGTKPVELQVGGYYKVHDPEIETRPGIKLRAKAEFWGPYHGFVFGGAIIEVTGEPVKEDNDQDNIHTRWIPVKVFIPASDYMSDFTAPKDAEGFMEQRWFGQQVDMAQFLPTVQPSPSSSGGLTLK